MDNAENVKLLDLELLRKDDIRDYDLERTEFNVYKWFKDFRKLQRQLCGGPQLLPSTQYKMVWVDESRNKIGSFTSLDDSSYLQSLLFNANWNLPLTKILFFLSIIHFPFFI